jgi:uncharacterized membrane protein YdbT with pleckstrin-like domain
MKIEAYLSTQLNEGEEVLAVIRRHPALLIPPLGLAIILILADFFFLAWLFAHGQFGAISFFLTLVIALLIGIRSLYLWRMNVVALTNHRVIDIDQRGLFERRVAEAALDKIQDVRYIIRGLWATLFSFGTVIVQTAGSTTSIEANGIHRPVEVQRLITDAQRQAMARPAIPDNRIVDIKRATKS